MASRYKRDFAAAVLALTPAFCAVGTVQAEQPTSPTKTTAEQGPTGSNAGVQDRKSHQQALEALRAEQKKAAEKEALLRAEIQALGENRRDLNKALIDVASRIRDLEIQVSNGEERLKTLDARELSIRASLEKRRAVIAEVLAVLQRMGRRPPPALLVAPEDALEAVRGAILLGAVVPEMRAEAQDLVSDLTELAGVRKQIISERHKSARDIFALTVDRQRMSLLIEERQKHQSEAEQALKEETKRAAELARKAESLQDLIAQMEKKIAAAARAADAARTSPAKPRHEKDRTNLAALRDPGRLVPAIAFVDAKGTLPLPVNGVTLREFGQPDRFGGAEKGVSIASRANAQVTAPCDGWVVYSGPFRSYGQLLILNAGGGYHVLLAGMERISVDLGQFVLTGEPVAVMGSERKAAALVAIGASQPVLYIEFRKDGTPVDPGPWWAKHDSEKVRG